MQIEVVDPVNDAAVDARSVIAVEVKYQLQDFESGTFTLTIAFPALASAMSVGGFEARHLVLEHPSARLRICLPLREVYEISRVQWPLRPYVVITRNLGKTYTGLGDAYEEVVRSEPVTLHSIEPAAETLRMQRAVVDPAYQEAVTALNLTILRMQALGRACPRLMDLQPEFEAAFQGWMSRNAAVIEQARARQLDLYERDMGSVHAEQVYRQVSAESVAQYTALPDAQLHEHCSFHVRAFSNPRSDLETAGAAQLLVIRQKAPEPLPAPRIERR